MNNVHPVVNSSSSPSRLVSMAPRIIFPLISFSLAMAIGSCAVKMVERDDTLHLQRTAKLAVDLKAYAETAGHLKELEGPIAFLAEVPADYAAGVRASRTLFAWSALLVAAAYFIAMKSPTFLSFKALPACALFVAGFAMCFLAVTAPSSRVIPGGPWQKDPWFLAKVVEKYQLSLREGTVDAPSAEILDDAYFCLRRLSYNWLLPRTTRLLLFLTLPGVLLVAGFTTSFTRIPDKIPPC